MPHVFPFAGLRYDPSVGGPLELVTAPPYDVISDARRGAFLSASEFNVVHLDLAEGSDDPADPSNRYARAAALITEWESAGALVRESAPSYKSYEMSFELNGQSRRIRGLICAMELEDWGGRVIPHERTMAGPVSDRLALLRATRTHMSPVYTTVDGPCTKLSTLLDETSRQPPLQSIVDEQGVRHRMWQVDGDEPLVAWLADSTALIADGHHRYATALQYRKERDRAEGPGPWDGLLTFLVDAGSERVPVLPFHRLQLSGEIPELGHRVGSLADVLDRISDEQVDVGIAIGVAGGRAEYRIAHLDAEPPAVRALHLEVLDASAPEGSLRYVPDAADADEAVRGGEAVAAWFLPATTPDRIRKIVERGERLPQKSTYFWPKPRTGMIMMPVDRA